MYKRWLILFLVPFLLHSWGNPVWSTEKPLNSKQILELVKGNTAEGQKYRMSRKIEYGKTTIIIATYFRSDGEAIERGRETPRSTPFPAHGEWWVKKNKICWKWRDSLVDKGKKKCRIVVPGADGSYDLYTGKGKKTHTWNRVVEGKPSVL